MISKMTDKVPPGYKKTDIGIIPEDWEVKKLGEKGEFFSGGTPDTSTKEYYKNEIPFITSSNLNKRRIKNTQLYISKKGLLHSSAKTINRGQLLLALYGATAGTVAISEIEGAINQAILAISSYAFDKYYLFYWFEKNKKNIIATYTQGGQPNLNSYIIKNLLIPLPPLTEQRAIARILSDFDALIESLDKLIEKKKAIKKGAMQELLTGKKRLPGFKGEWVRKRLGEIGKIAGAGVDKKIKRNEITVRLLNYLDVYNRDFLYKREINFWTTAPKMKIEQCNIKKGDVFFTPSSETQTDIAISAVAVEDMPGVVYSYHIVRFRIKENWDLKFRTYIFKTREFLSQAERMAEGSGKRYVISLRKFRELEISYPPTLAEQRAIAQILSDMDAEIETLEQKKKKYEMMKKGAMELLLTGKIRVNCEL